MMKTCVTIIGAGPAGLFCSYFLLKRGFRVNLYDQMSGVGKKFLVAGKGGLNLTHSSCVDEFSEYYGKDQLFFKQLIEDFSPQDLKLWCEELGVETFVGSSGRVFPTKMNAAEMLTKWLSSLKSFDDFNLYLNHRLTDFSYDKNITFTYKDQLIKLKADKIIFTLGGASWKKTGSDGRWMDLFSLAGINCKKFLPMNCGFECKWSPYFTQEVDRSPLKNVEVSFEEDSIRGEVMLTPYGIEGGAVYALSNKIRDRIIQTKRAQIYLDLKPDLSLDQVISKISNREKGVSLSNHLRKKINFSKVMTILLRELSDANQISDINYLAKQIKKLEVKLTEVRPIEEAISSGGGVLFSELNSNLELKSHPGVYVGGEMLDYEAPTGGYLLQGCFSTGWRIVQHLTSGEGENDASS